MGQSLRLLFLCTGNSCRSQMAEGLCRHIKGDRIEAYSAGTETHGLNPLAVKVMQEIGIDISNHRSKTLENLSDVSLDVVVTVCSNAHETCPVFPGSAWIIHQGFDDPPKCAANAANEAEALVHYRRARDEIRDWIETLPETLAATTGA